MSCAAKKRLVVHILINPGTKTTQIDAYVCVELVSLVRTSMNIFMSRNIGRGMNVLGQL